MSKRLRVAFDAFEAGVSMRRASLRREHPHADPDDIERLLREWLAIRPGAEHGDAGGTPRVLEPATPRVLEPATPAPHEPPPKEPT